ncbi:MAG: hypothetical protein IKX89_04795 [Firmicutes bacterium]|nr:hypothetical protein [Bacillota bacterium]
MNDINGKRLLGGSAGSAAKYKQLVLKIQEYPINKELLALEENAVGPSGPVVMEPCFSSYAARPVERRAVRIAELKRRIREVDKALEAVPAEYREGVLYHTLNHGSKTAGIGSGSAWEDSMFSGAHRNTWTKWKARFILEYAQIIGEGDYIRMLMEHGPELKEMEKY